MQLEPKALQVTQTFGRLNEEVRKIRVSPDGKTAIAIGYEGQAIFLNRDHGSTVRHEDIFDAAFRSDDAGCVHVVGAAGLRRLSIPVGSDHYAG